MQAQCQREVVELHGFLVNWMTGAVPRSAAAFARFADVLADGFVLISPRGEITERRALLRRGARVSPPPYCRASFPG